MESLSNIKPSVSLPHTPCKSNSSSVNLGNCSIINAVPTSIFGFQRKPITGSWNDRFDRKIEFRIPYYRIHTRNHYRVHRKTVVRSELVNTGYSDAAFSLTEFQLGSKLRGICFYAVTSFLAIFLFTKMLVVHPFVLAFDRYRRKAHHLIAKIWASVTIAPFFKIEFEGLENLPPPDAAAVYVSNHQSFLDIYTLLTLGRSFKFISKTEIFIIPIVGWAMFLMGLIPLRRLDSRSQLDCLKRCMELIRKGASVFFFPEGTRSKDGKLGTFKVHLALRPRLGHQLYRLPSWELASLCLQEWRVC